MEQLYRIMVVDDERIIREAIAGHIPWEKYGIIVSKAAANAVEAFEYFRENPVELILADIRMPVMDGLGLLKEIRALRRDVEFIILSGYADFSYAQEALRYGARDYLLKPVDEAALVNLVLNCKREWEGKHFLQEVSSLRETPGGFDAQNRRYSQVVQRIVNIVREELANEELSLKWISSRKLFLNENYLSRLFFKEVGTHFSAFLLRERMTLAMELLAAEEGMLIRDVAEAVGFGDNAQYFSVVFKKFTGYMPKEYRRYMKEARKN